MPDYCTAFSCKNRRGVESKERGITFHKFPNSAELRRKWDYVVRIDKFKSTKSSVLCSEHFKEKDFDRTGQTVRLRDGVIPSVFDFPAHLQRRQKSRTTRTSKKAEEVLIVEPRQEPETPETPSSHPHPQDDHCYALPGCLDSLKAIIDRSTERVESLEKERKNANARVKRAKILIQCVLEDLRKKNLLNKQLKRRLDFYSGKNGLFLASSSTR